MALTDNTMRQHSSQSLAGSVGTMVVNTGTSLAIPVWIYLLTVTVPIGFNVGPLAMTTLRLFLLVMTVPLMGNLFAGKYGKVIVTDYFFLLHFLWATVALSVNNPDKVVQQMGSVGIEFLGGYVVGRAYIRTTDDFVALCKGLVLLVCCTMPLAIYETMTGRPILVEFLRRIPGATSVPIVTIEGRVGLERVQANFAHPIHFGLFCSVAFSLSFVALKGTISEARRFVMSAMIAVTGFLALSSGALLAIAAQMALITWAAVFASVKQRWWILVGLFAIAYVVIDILSNRSPIKVFMSYATFSAHNAYWRALIFEWGSANVIGSVEKGIVGSPLFGIGLNDWIRPHFMNSGSMDNFWLVMAVRYGLPGLIFLAIGYIYAIARIMRRNFEGNERLTLIRRAWVFTFLGLSFTLCTVHVWTNVYSFVFFMFGAGIWLIAVEASHDGQEVPSNALSKGARKRPTYSRSLPPPAPQPVRGPVHAPHQRQSERFARNSQQPFSRFSVRSYKD